ncbi:hypothetical protein UFOVP265_43 [uncultured Caudovirales phage]|uniref:Uncharacterized protein n=1 Tax=uncultured Caudovirales phage TaxID=2100421 RepID=A0A6J5LLR9_9CAUD|nr:hypothetical protein UFOVP265_43 [uncultured Caudovirales phage]
MTEIAQEALTEQQKENTVKEYLFKQFVDKYKDLTNFVMRIQFNEGHKHLIIQHFDTAFLWAKEAFVAMSLKQNEPELIDTVTSEELDEAIKKAN